MTDSCKESCAGGAPSRWSANTQTWVPSSTKRRGTKKEGHSSPKVTYSHRQTARIPPISLVPLPPSAALPSRPGEPGVSPPGVPVHLRALVHATPLVLPTASLEHSQRPPQPPGYSDSGSPRTVSSRFALTSGNSPPPPEAEPGAQAGVPRGVGGPEPRPSLPAQLGEGLEIQLLYFLLAQPVANSLPFQKGLHLPLRAGSSGPEEIAHRPSLAARRAPRACGHLLPAAGTRNGAPSAQSCREGRAGAGRAPGRRERRSARHSTGCHRAGGPAPPPPTPPPPAGLRARKFASAGPGRGGEEAGPPSPAPPSRRSEPSRTPSSGGHRRSAPALGLRAAPKSLLPTLPLAHDRGGPSRPSPRRRVRPIRAERVPFPTRSDPGRAHAAARAPRRPHPPPPPPLPPCPGPRPGARHAAVATAALTRPAGPLDPAGAEEARARRPPGGSTARRLLKAPRLSPRVWFFGACCVKGSAVKIGGWREAGLDLGRSLPSAFTF